MLDTVPADTARLLYGAGPGHRGGPRAGGTATGGNATVEAGAAAARAAVGSSRAVAVVRAATAAAWARRVRIMAVGLCWRRDG
ncbi:hypothetical protein GXW82_12750 [Streptacidiphilus sp. 4-A2]|nr:hypothetical protein [Streptacidiphilus sp. 4-A2]